MTWARIDDSFYDHPKARAAGLEGRALYLCALVDSNRNLTDGAIATHDLPILAAKAGIEYGPSAVADLLVDVGLWEEREEGWQIHDFLDWNKSAEEVRQIRAARAEAGRKGGRSKKPARQADASAKAQASASADAPASGEAKTNPSPSPSPSPSPIPDPLLTSSSVLPVGTGQDAIDDDPRMAIAIARARRLYPAEVKGRAWLRSVAASIDPEALAELSETYPDMSPAELEEELDEVAR